MDVLETLVDEERSLMTEKNYFAFVESISEVPRGNMAGGTVSKQWMELASQRELEALPPPTHEVWLDCVGADYFSDLPWVDQPFDESNADDRQRRRAQIADLCRKEMVALNFVLSVHDKAESRFIRLLNRGSWVRIMVGHNDGIPIVICANFDDAQTAGVIGSIVHFGRPDRKDTGRLFSVFNVDFIPPMDYDDNGEPGWILPEAPHPSPKPKTGVRPKWMVPGQEESAKAMLDPRLGTKRYFHSESEE